MGAHLLSLSAVPAIVASLWLMKLGSAPSSLIVQQASFGLGGLVAAVIATQRVWRGNRHASSLPALALLVVCLFLPLALASPPLPARWFGALGFRLYLAPVVLPLFLVLWSDALAAGPQSPWPIPFVGVLAGFALLAQPDASQLSALAAAAVPLLWRSKQPAGTKFLVLIALAALAALSWTRPDPTSPVAYVEGVFLLAANSSPLLLAVAAVAATLPVAGLLLSARTTSSYGLLSVAIYYAVLLVLGIAQVTPVPLLGFGAGPILGYFIMSSQAPRERRIAA